MLRRLALLLIPLVIFAAACSSDDDTSSDDEGTPTVEATATVAAIETDEPASEPTAVVIDTPDLSGAYDFGGGDDSAGFINALNPLGLLSNIDAGIAIDGASPELAGQLLSAGDLPSGFISMGDYNMSIPTGEFGTMDMAMNMFASGDITSTGELGTMVMSAAIVLSPEARAEMGVDNLDALSDLSDADLDAIRTGSEMFGVTISDLHLLDASGLGEGGAGMHMEMDFSGMMDAFGAPPGGEMPTGMAWDMYMFFEGDYMHMVMVMYSTGASSGVDARHLADVLDGRTGGTA